MKKTIFLILLCFIQTTQAKKLFKYKDDKGIWHYSDRAPSTNQPVEVRQLKVTQKRYIWLEKTGGKDTPEYFAINNYHGPVELQVILDDNKNAVASPALPNQFIIQPGQSDILFKMSGKNKSKSWQYSLQYKYTLGSSLAQHNEKTSYLPPFAKNLKFQITQAFGGTFSHTDKQNYYAVDIAMPENTPIHAARSGTVMEVNNDYFNSGTKQAYKSRANSVRILHEDGSMAVYAHLALEKANVYPGLRVKAGQLIAYSGNTGFSSGPHLHFSIQINKGMELASTPFKFSAGGNSSISPSSDEWLINPK